MKKKKTFLHFSAVLPFAPVSFFWKG